jgi:hypothetical protein
MLVDDFYVTFTGLGRQAYVKGVENAGTSHDVQFDVPTIVKNNLLSQYIKPSEL